MQPRIVAALLQVAPWYRVVLDEDRLDDVACKLEHYAKVIEARAAMRAAEAEFRRLNG